MLVGCDYTYKLGTCREKFIQNSLNPWLKLTILPVTSTKDKNFVEQSLSRYFMAIGQKVSGQGSLGSFEKQSVVLVVIISIQS